MKIKDVAEIRTGLVLARKKANQTDSESHNYKIITIKSLDSDGWLNLAELSDFESYETLNSGYLTKKGDIIIRLTTPFTAVTVKEENLVIPSNFAIIRIHDQKILPEYLSIVLNSDHIKKKFSQEAIGVTIPLLKTEQIKETEILEKPITEQKKIAELNELRIKEKKLIKSFLEEKEKLNRLIMNKIIS